MVKILTIKLRKNLKKIRTMLKILKRFRKFQFKKRID